MSNFNDLINVVNTLPTGTQVKIQYDWCTAHGLNVTPNMMKSWGQLFSNGVKKGLYGCTKDKTISPAQGTASHKKINNLCHYIKI